MVNLGRFKYGDSVHIRLGETRQALVEVVVVGGYKDLRGTTWLVLEDPTTYCIHFKPVDVFTTPQGKVQKLAESEKPQ